MGTTGLLGKVFRVGRQRLRLLLRLYHIVSHDMHCMHCTALHCTALHCTALHSGLFRF
jgi:hypothetical protein